MFSNIFLNFVSRNIVQMSTIIIKDNQTGYLYKTKYENVLEQTVSVLPPLFHKLSIILDNPDEKIIERFGLDMEYTTASPWRYDKIPVFDWKNIILEDHDFGGIARGMNPYIQMKKMYDYARKHGSVIVYVTRTGNIARKPLYGSMIPSFDSIIGIYRQAYMNGAPNGVGAYLITKEKEIKNMMEFYKSIWRK